PQKCPVVAGVSGAKGGQDRTLFELAATESPPQTPAKTPVETPAPYARAGKEPQNPRTGRHPPSPPQDRTGGGTVLVQETYVTESGRRRRRAVRVDLDDVRSGLEQPSSADLTDWRRICDGLLGAVGENTYAIWFAPLQLIAVDRGGLLLVAAP